MQSTYDLNFFKKDFFVKGVLGYTIRDHVYEHLFSCKECYELYKQFAKENNYSFNLREDAIDFAKGFNIIKTNPDFGTVKILYLNKHIIYLWNF